MPDTSPAPVGHHGITTGNVYDKYNTTNPVARMLMDGFLRTFDQLLQTIPFDSVLEVGCGEGHLTNHLLQRRKLSTIAGLDIGMDVVRQAHENTDAAVCQANAMHLPYEDNSFDLVVCCEVLEHVDDPFGVLRELARVSRRFALLSVPREPLWRVLNMVRGSYLSDFGNTPGHVNHWGVIGFKSTVATSFNVREVRSPLPWTMILAEVKFFEMWEYDLPAQNGANLAHRGNAEGSPE